MNLLLLKPEDFISDSRAVVTGRRLQHLRKVNRVSAGDYLKCGLLGGMMGKGRVLTVSGNVLEIEADLKYEPPKPLPLTLVLALPRPKVVRRVVQQVTTMGVKQVYFMNSWRVEKSYWQSPLLGEAELCRQMILGLEQSGDTILPEIHMKRFFSPFVKEELPALSEGSERIVAHPLSPQKCPHGLSRPCTLAIGPEGGFIDIEIKTLKENGFLPYHIGERVLKVETAVTLLISRLYL